MRRIFLDSNLQGPGRVTLTRILIYDTSTVNTELIQNSQTLFRTIFSAGMKAHQRLTMANGNRVNLFARDGKEHKNFSSGIRYIKPVSLQID